MKLTEEELRRITLKAINELGENASHENVKKAVRDIINRSTDTIEAPVAAVGEDSGRIILTSFGLNKPGVVAAITAKMGEFGIDIQDMTQKLMDDFFTIIMLVDISNSPKDLKGVQDAMNEIAEQMKIKIFMQHEDIFRTMHRL